MKIEEFLESIRVGELPSELSMALTALWLDARGDWTAAHDQLQDAGDLDSDWVHAYLHRKEGDLINAAYWYRRDKRKVFEGTFKQEWDAVVLELLTSTG